MILFFKTPTESVIATEVDHQLSQEEVNELCWLYGDATLVEADHMDGYFVGPRREMITPWSTNAVEITQNMNLKGVSRIEEYFPVSSKDAEHDPMLQRMYEGLDQQVFTVNHKPEPIKHVDNLEEYNEQEGLALSPEEIDYLHNVEKQLGRPLTDSEIFGFAQINSEHCRHKIFGGVFIIDGKEMESSLFSMIKKTTKENPHKILSAYKEAVCARRPVNFRLVPRQGHRERHLTEGRNAQLPYHSRAFQRRRNGYGRRNPRPHGRRNRLLADSRHGGVYDGVPSSN